MNPQEYEFLIKVGQYLAIPFLLMLGGGIKWAIDKFTASKNTAYDQLTVLFKILQEELAKKASSDRSKDDEIEELEKEIDCIRVKLKTAQLDLLDLRQSMRNIRRFLKDNGISDEGIMAIVDELETKLKEIEKCLKSND